MASKPIDFSKSRAILIGTSEHTRASGLASMPAALNSLDAMEELLTGPNCGWPSERVERFVNKTTSDGTAGDIASLISEATDVILLYYVGHGQLLRGGDDLGMALTDTSNRVELRRATSLRLNDIREDLRYCQCRIKLVILDCCFSGIATKNTQGAGDLADRIERAARVAGSFTLTASRAHQSAIYEDGNGGLTYFTKVLAEIIQEGIPGRSEELTLADIHQELEQRFDHLNIPDQFERPEPTRLFHDTADRFVFARNAAPPQKQRTMTIGTPQGADEIPGAPRSRTPVAQDTDDPVAGQLARLRRRALKLSGGPLAAGTVLGAAYATHHQPADPDSAAPAHPVDSHAADAHTDSAWTNPSDDETSDAPGPHGSAGHGGTHVGDIQLTHDASAADSGSFDGGG